MPALVALVLIAAFAFAVFGVVVHLLFSPLLLVAAVAILVWMKFGPHRTRR